MLQGYVGVFLETNISHLGKRKVIFKYAFSGGYVNFLEGTSNWGVETLIETCLFYGLGKPIGFEVSCSSRWWFQRFVFLCLGNVVILLMTRFQFG